MNINEEKIYIYGMLKDITIERRKLVDMYYDLKKRLDFLNSMEEKGIQDLSIKGYADLHNQNQKEAIINNMQREVEYQVEKIENYNIIEEKEKSPIPKEVIQRAVEKERQKIKRTRINREKVDGAVITALKDAGTPIKLQELLNRVNVILDYNLNKGTFQNKVLSQLMEKNKKVERPTRGFYQYRS